jgi:hypothetical protein
MKLEKRTVSYLNYLSCFHMTQVPKGTISELGCAAHIRFEANISEYEANIYSL